MNRHLDSALASTYPSSKATPWLGVGSLVLLACLLLAPGARGYELVWQPAIDHPGDYAISGDGRILVVADSRSDSVGIWHGPYLRWLLEGSSIELSRDASKLLVRSQSPGSPLRLVDVATGEELLSLGLEARGMAMVGDRRFAVLLPAALELYDFEGQRLWRREDPRLEIAYGVTLVASETGDFLAMRSREGYSIWSLGDGALLASEKCGLGTSLQTTAVSGDGRSLGVLCRDAVHVWRGDDLRLLPLERRAEQRSLHLDHRGKFLVTASRDAILVFDLEGPSSEPVSRIETKDRFGDLAISPAGDLVAYSTTRGPAVLVSLPSGEPVRRLQNRLWIEKPSFSPDGATLRGLSMQRFCAFDVDSGELRRRTAATLAGGVQDLEITADGRYLLASHRGFTRLFDFASGGVSTLEGSSFAVSADGAFVVTGPTAERAHLWRLEDRTFVAELTHQEAITAVAGDRTGRFFATGGSDGSVTLWDAEGRALRRLQGRQRPIDKVLLDVEARRLFAGHRGGQVSGFRLDEGSLLPAIGHPAKESLRLLEWSLGGKLLTAGMNEHRAYLWHPESGDEHLRLELADAPTAVTTLDLEPRALVVATRNSRPGSVFGADGAKLADWYGQPTIEALDSLGPFFAAGDEHGKVVIRRHGEKVRARRADGAYGRITRVAFDSLGRFLAAGDSTGAVSLWNAKGELIARLMSASSQGWAVVTPDQRFDTSGDEHFPLVAWEGLEPHNLRRYADRRARGLLAEAVAAAQDGFGLRAPRPEPVVTPAWLDDGEEAADNAELEAPGTFSPESARRE